jgi:hypothetical protein
MPPAFNLSQDQTLKFNLSKLNSSSLTLLSTQSFCGNPKIATPIKHPHLSVVLLFKEHVPKDFSHYNRFATAPRLLREGRILHTLSAASSLFRKLFEFTRHSDVPLSHTNVHQLCLSAPLQFQRGTPYT